MGTAVIVGLLGLFRIATLTAERVAIHGLGKARQGSLATMGIGFGGAAVVLWLVAWWQGQVIWVPSTMWTGVVYAVAFGFYTASLTQGSVSAVSPWTNATVVILWLIHPFGSLLSWSGLGLFALGAWFLTVRRISRAVLWMLISDVLLAVARFIDVTNADQPPLAYAASLFTCIGLWMLVPIVLFGEIPSLARLFFLRPGWSVTAACTNAAAYVALFGMLKFVHPAVIEAISALASVAATLVGIVFLKEAQGRRKILASTLMTFGTVLLLLDLKT
ncbi:hypothetical protein [Alicyclobacillus dauci]|uniref:EamA-like transporter family protein n=1 Tax=Alicyclobacillus dauci TaxID=1475485 RepID=A0ABY6Z830_9BACL|nr:hypothetical protein [Alicyclobacillus dauci]WAH38688.1 hypothetical protein NZD86_09495 [Alicyclobacillus dauci]